MSKGKDNRPICDCPVYSFPHKIGGKCKGHDFLEYTLWNNKEICSSCINYGSNSCDVLNGSEPITDAPCYQDRLHYNPGEYLPSNPKQ